MTGLKKTTGSSVRRLPYLRTSRGFTLIEMIIVVALIGILTAVAVPSIIQMRNSMNYRGASRDVASILRNARSLAISENREYQVDIDTANRQYRLRRGDRVSGSANWTVIKDYVALPAGVTIATSEPTSFFFRPNGAVAFNPDTDGDSTNDETISIRDTGGTTKHTITISPTTGRIRVS